MLRALYYNPGYWDSHRDLVIISVAFHVLISFLFASRFFLLFQHGDSAFGWSEIIWLSCVVSLYVYSCVTNNSIYGFFFSSTFGYGWDGPRQEFLNATNSFAALGVLYFLLSPVRHVLTLLIAILK